jgi:antirestriction protein ArdC
MTTRTKQRFDVHEAVTQQIITAIEAGPGQVTMPWHRNGAAITRPTNISTGNAYRGINTIALWAAATTGGFAEGLWGTYRQWQDRGAQVRKGETSSLIIFYKEFDREDDDRDDDQATIDRRFMVKSSRVFNVAQVDGYAHKDLDVSADPIDPIAAADAFVQATGAAITEGGESAFYHRTNDTITMPDRFRFIDTSTSTAKESWYSVLLHELTHWTGADSRMARTFGERFGDDAYAMEELVAEIGAAFLCADLGITAEPRPDHAAYIDHWLRIMKGDKKAIFAAASAATKASTFLGSLQPAGAGSSAVGGEEGAPTRHSGSFACARKAASFARIFRSSCAERLASFAIFRFCLRQAP